MRIGIEMRQVVLGQAGGIALLVKGVVETLFRKYPHDKYIVFSSIFNRGLLQDADSHVQFVTIPLHGYDEALDQAIETAAIDVLFRAYPEELTLQFPMSRQVFHIPDI